LTLAEFRAEYPQFNAVDDYVIQRQIDIFSCLYQGDYGCSADYLAGLFVAHQVFVSSKSGASPVQTMGSRAVGDVSISFNQSSAADSAKDFASSKFGLEFSRLIRMFGMGAMVTGANSVVSCCGQ
jgi:hypothetical protein